MGKMIYNRERCIGCAYCVEIAPGFWKMNEEDGKCDLIGSLNRNDAFVLDVFADEMDIHKEVVEICPGKCMRLEE